VCSNKDLENDILDKRFMNISAEMAIRSIVGWKNKYQWQEMGINMIEYKEKCERMIGKYESEVETRLDDC
jgi:hypothetical protein